MFFKKLKGELLYDPAIICQQSIGIYLGENHNLKRYCTPMFISALFTIAKTGKQPKCPSTEEWVKMWYIYTVEYVSVIKKNKIMSFEAIWMDLEVVLLSEVSQRKVNI